MLKRELIRTLFLFFVGCTIMLYMLFTKSVEDIRIALIMPLYVIGIIYGGKTLVMLFAMMLKKYFSGQFFSLVVNPLWGTVLCLVLFSLGLAGLVGFGWLIGIMQWIMALIRAFQMDRQFAQTTQQNHW